MNYSASYRTKYLLNVLWAVLLLSAQGCTEHKSAEVIEHKTIEAKSTTTTPTEKAVKHIENGTVYFADGSSTKTGLFDLKYITQLPAENGIPFIVASGTDCDNCDENTSIWIFPANPVVTPHRRYTYPGKEQDYMDKSLLFSSRMFYGDCLGKRCVAWVQTDHSESGAEEQTIFIVQVKNDTLIEERRTYNERTVTKLMQCTELPGIDVTSEP